MSTEIRIHAAAPHVRVVELARGPNNFLTFALLSALADGLDALATDRDVRAVVLCSEGKHFCAGADFSTPDAVAGPEGRHLYDIAWRVFAQPLPLVAAVQGAAIGGGMGLALAADFRVASRQAYFSANFARLGFHHGFALTATLPPVVGRQAALDLLYTGRRVPGEEAFAMKLCDRLVEADRLREEACALASQLAASAPLAVRAIRQTLRGTMVNDIRSVLAHEREQQARLRRTRDFAEGVAARAQRREPNFKGE